MALPIRIPVSCTQRWEELEPAENGTRLCSRCHQHVTDFRGMSYDEVMLAHALAGGRICGVYDESQLRGDTPRRPTAPPRLVTLALGATLLSGTAAAQSSSPPSTPTVQTPLTPPRVPAADAEAAQPSPAPTDTFVIRGTVRDEEGRPLHGAMIVVEGQANRRAWTDSLGTYTLKFDERRPGESVRLRFIQLGRDGVIVDVPRKLPEMQIDATLEPSVVEIEGIVVRAAPERRSILHRVLSILR